MRLNFVKGLGTTWAVIVLLNSAGHAATPAVPDKISQSVLSQIAALEQEKAGRTPTEQKIDSSLLFAHKMELGLPIAKGIRTQRVRLVRDNAGSVLVDIDAQVTDSLIKFLGARGKIVNAFPQYHAVRARVALGDIIGLAARNDVHFVGPAVRAVYSRVDSQGDWAHQAYAARKRFGVNGTGVTVGVLSDSLDFLANSQIAGLVTYLPGQDAGPEGSHRTGEGTAMLEIVNDLAPGAKLYFATAEGGPANFANNIVQLRAAGCDIIVDDAQYRDESPFQDGLIAQAVDAVTANGALYFSASGNMGNIDYSTSATWEGDFSDAGVSNIKIGHLLNFGNGTKTNDYNTILPGFSATDLGLNLFWSDPIKHSANDYDVFVLDSTGLNVVASSTMPQTGTQDPYEHVDTPLPYESIVVVKVSGDDRFLHLDVGQGRLALATAGQIRGHCCSAAALAVAAVDAAEAYPNAFVTSDLVEPFCSDGPRHVFFNIDGTPITPGDFSSSGGTVLQKPDVAAADGVITDLDGFNPFFGTSAAAPHAAAIAALVMSYPNFLGASQVRSILTGTALDIMGPGMDRDSGAGILMAPGALQAVQSAGYSAVPSVQIKQPLNESTLSGQALVNVTAEDVGSKLVGIGLYRFSSSAATGFELIGSSPDSAATFVWDTTTVLNGNYAVFGVATNAAGNEGYSKIINVTVQNVPGQRAATFGNFFADPLWQAANAMIVQDESILGTYLGEIAIRNGQIIGAAIQQSIAFGHPVTPRLVTPDQQWINRVNAQIDQLLEREYRIQLRYLHS